MSNPFLAIAQDDGTPPPPTPGEGNPFMSIANGNISEEETPQASSSAAPAANPFLSIANGETTTPTTPTPASAQQSEPGWSFAHKVKDIWNSDDEGTLGKIWDTVNTPLLDLKRNGATGVEAGAEEFASGLTSPLSAGLALVSMGAGPLLERLGIDAAAMAGPKLFSAAKTVGKLATAGFTIQQLKGISDESPFFVQAIKNGDTDKALEIGTTMLLNAATAGIGAKHALREFGVIGDDNEAVTPKDLMVGRFTERLKKDTDVATRFNKDFKKAVPDQTDREALHFYGEAAGDKMKLADWQKQVTENDSIAPDLKRQVVRDLQRAQNLNADVTGKLDDLRGLYDEVHEKASAVDAQGNPMPTHIMESTSHRENYLARAPWDTEDDEADRVEKANAAMGQAGPDHTQRRLFDTTIDGILQGKKPRKIGGRYILDSADLASDYYKAMGREMARKQFVEEAKTTFGSDNRPLAAPGGSIAVIDGADRDENGVRVPNGNTVTILNSEGSKGHKLTKLEMSKLIAKGQLQDMIDKGLIIDRGPKAEPQAQPTPQPTSQPAPQPTAQPAEAPTTQPPQEAVPSPVDPLKALAPDEKKALYKEATTNLVNRGIEFENNERWGDFLQTEARRILAEREKAAGENAGTEEAKGQAAITNNPNLDKFMEGSKVVDESGAPKQVYHGTRRDFDTFDESKLGQATSHRTSKLGFFFTESPEVADSFTKRFVGPSYAEERHLPNANVMPAYLNVKNPLVMTPEEYHQLISDTSGHHGEQIIADFKQKAIDDGHDGILIKGDKELGKTEDGKEYAGNTWIAFDKNQIKSSIGNNGNFSPEEASILASTEKVGKTQYSPDGFFGELRKDKDGQHILWLGDDAMSRLQTAAGWDKVLSSEQARLGGVSLSKDDISSIKRNLRGEGLGTEDFQLRRLLQSAADVAKKEGVTVVGHFNDSLHHTIDKAREEVAHAGQRILSMEGGIDGHLSKEKFKELNEAIPKSIHGFLDERGYQAHPAVRVVEASAKLMAGLGDKMGVSDEEAASWLRKYYTALKEQHGNATAGVFKHVVGLAKSLRDEILEHEQNQEDAARISDGQADGRDVEGPGVERREPDSGSVEEETGGKGGEPGARGVAEEEDPHYYGRYRYDTSDYDNSIRNRHAWTSEYGGADNVKLRAPVAFHPEIAKQAKLILNPEKSFLQKNPVTNKILGLSTQAKQSLLNLSGFHWVQIGLRAVESGVNPFKSILEMKDGVNGWDLDNPNNPDQVRQRKLVEANGIAPGIDHGMYSFSEGLKGHGPLSKIPGFGPMLDSMNNALFGPNGFIDRVKLQSALDFERRLRTTNPGMTEMERYKAAGQLSNQRFGGLNYLAMGRSQTARDIMRLTLLAPDWLESNLRDAASTMGPLGKLSRFDFARIALYNFVAAQTLNYLTTGKMHLDQPFGVVSKDGKKVYSVRTLPEDIFHALTQPMDYFSNRLNPLIARTGVEALTGRDHQGHLRTMGQQLQDLAENITPIPLHGVVNTLTGNFHPGEDAMDYVRSAAGLTTKTNNSPAESMAYKLASQNSSGGVPSDQAAHFHRVMEYEDRLRGGDASAMDDVRRDLAAGKLAPADFKQIAKGATVNRLQAVVNRLPMSQAIDVWNLATKDEREGLSVIMAKKMAAYRKTEFQKLTPSERARMDVKLAGVMDSMMTHAGIQ